MQNVPDVQTSQKSSNFYYTLAYRRRAMKRLCTGKYLRPYPSMVTGKCRIPVGQKHQPWKEKQWVCECLKWDGKRVLTALRPRASTPPCQANSPMQDVTMANSNISICKVRTLESRLWLGLSRSDMRQSQGHAPTSLPIIKAVDWQAKCVQCATRHMHPLSGKDLTVFNYQSQIVVRVTCAITRLENEIGASEVSWRWVSI